MRHRQHIHRSRQFGGRSCRLGPQIGLPWVAMPEVYGRESRRWIPAHEGVEYTDLHRHEPGGGAALFRLQPGARIPMHDHPRGEHTYVIEGTLEFGDVRVSAGDALWTEPGESHEVRAITHAMFVGVSPPRV